MFAERVPTRRKHSLCLWEGGENGRTHGQSNGRTWSGGLAGSRIWGGRFWNSAQGVWLNGVQIKQMLSLAWPPSLLLAHALASPGFLCTVVHMVSPRCPTCYGNVPSPCPNMQYVRWFGGCLSCEDYPHMAFSFVCTRPSCLCRSVPSSYS